MPNPTLHYHRAGHGKNLVLIHGWGFDANIWNTVLPTLTPHFRVTWFDLPGYGQNAAFTEHSLAALAQQIQTIIPANSSVLGWSLGGLIATQIAQHYTDKVSQLILLNSSPCFASKQDWPGVPPQIFDTFNEKLNQNTAATWQQFMKLACFPRVRVEQPALASQPILAAGLKLLRDTDLRAVLPHLNCKQLYLFAELDQIVPVETQQALQPLTTQQHTQTIQQAGHVSLISHADHLQAAIKAFLSEPHYA